MRHNEIAGATRAYELGVQNHVVVKRIIPIAAVQFFVVLSAIRVSLVEKLSGSGAGWSVSAGA